jgi:glycosyltransferase involved in cell wall biosynthesis
MNIAVVSDAVWPYFKGGKERRIYEVTRRLVASGHDVHVYTMKWWDGGDTVQVDGVWMHAICKLYPLYNGERRSIKEGILFSLACFKLIAKKFDVADVDHMPYFPLYTMRLVCWLKRRALFATWHEVWGKQYWQTYLGGISGTVAYSIERCSVLLPNVIIAVSPMTAQKLTDLYRVKSNRLVLASNGVDKALLRAVPKSKRTSDVIFIGRLLKHKNAAMLIQAIAKVRESKPNVQCVIVGQGPETKAVRALARRLKLGNNITFIAHVPENKDLASLLKASKLFVMPSEREGFGLVAIEANACNIPVLTLKHPENAISKLIISGKNGDVFADADELAAQIVTWLNSKKAKDLQEYVAEFDWDVTTKKIEEGYAL